MYYSKEMRTDYFPPLLSNGEISFAPDAEGTIAYTREEMRAKGVQGFDGIVVRAARRSALCKKVGARFFPMGKFVFRAGASLEKWDQNLTVTEGTFESNCVYADGVFVSSKGFIHPQRNIYALQKTFYNVHNDKKVAFDLLLCGYNTDIAQYIQVLYAKTENATCRVGFRMYGMEVFTGELCMFVDKPFATQKIENGIRMIFDVTEGEQVSFYYTLEDNMNGTDFQTVLQENVAYVNQKGFLRLMADCRTHFEHFYMQGYVETSDDRLNEIYKTALYAIKSNTTSASIAVGFNNGSWDGEYFAFDEFTSFHALLGANRSDLARRVTEYRLRECLPHALKRASDCHSTEYTEEMARFHWQSGETDDMELTDDGNWMDHVFHIPLVGIGAFEYYEYTKDEAFLRECYRMIRACAKFITKHMVYQNGEKRYIGKCTDLERLGSSVENPFMTCCGAIQLLDCCAQAADILRMDAEYAAECKFIAKKLRESLPIERDMYVPHLNCKQKSIAVYAGKFPFDVLENDDPYMLNAWTDYEKSGQSFGNMYPIGKSISPWYACWKALAYARALRTEHAYLSLQQAYASIGVFHELFEINEPNIHKKPWFATAAGVFVAAVNEMLLQSDGKTIRILPAFPHDADVSFQLATKGGVVVTAKIRNSILQNVTVSKDGLDVTNEYRIIF